MITDREQKRLLIEAIGRIEGACQTIRSLLEAPSPTAPQVPKSPSTPSVGATTSSGPSPKPKPQPTKSKRAKYASAESLPAAQLGPTPDINDDNWPFAIQPHLIVSSEADDAEKQFRALQVVGILGLDFTDTTTLDFGCGGGHVAKEIAGQAKKVVGYDIKEDEIWKDKAGDNLILSTDNAHVIDNAPYDRIILYDVLDHLQNEDPVEVLDKLRSILAPDGQIFCRCHPWTSKHGSHLYEKVNKAYVHLVLTPDELAQAGYVPEYNLRLVKPMAAYNNWFESAGLQIQNRKVTQDAVPEFFIHHGEILDRIRKVTWGGKLDRDQALKIMSNQFVDYLLGT